MNLADVECYTCGKKGHLARTCHDGFQARREERKWDRPQRGRGRGRGRDREYVKKADGETEAEPTSFCFFQISDCPTQRGDKKGLMVDCGATTHIINDPNKFMTVDESFRLEGHTIELADVNQVERDGEDEGRRRSLLTGQRGTTSENEAQASTLHPIFSSEHLFSESSHSQRSRGSFQEQ